MDQDEFRSTYHQYNENNCVFEKSILTNECNCTKVERFCIAEREGAHCQQRSAREQCEVFLEALRKETRFALKTTEEKGMLPHGKAIKIQVGGLRGVHAALAPEDDVPKTIADIHALLNRAITTFNSIEGLPFSTIMQHISAYKIKVRSRRRK